MSVDKVIEYVMRSPENTNPAVLKSIIETEYTKPGGGGSVALDVYTVDDNSENPPALLEHAENAPGAPYSTSVQGIFASTEYISCEITNSTDFIDGQPWYGECGNTKPGNIPTFSTMAFPNVPVINTEWGSSFDCILIHYSSTGR